MIKDPYIGMPITMGGRCDTVPSNPVKPPQNPNPSPNPEMPGGGGAGNHTYSLGQNGIPADLGMYNVMRYLWGNETIAEDGYDPKSPSEGFRLQMQKTISPYEITGFPTIVYYDEDTSYRMNELSVMLGDRMDAEIAKFIVGERSLDEFDAFVEELEALGLREYEGYFQDAYANYLASSN